MNAKWHRHATSAALRLLIAVFGALLLTNAADAQARRIALLVGNATYSKDVGELKNPERDVDAVSDALISIGFKPADIQIVTNADRKKLKAAIDQLSQRAKGMKSSDLVFFYYSGHGAVPAGTKSMNLIPTDARNAESPTFWYDTISLDDEVIKKFKEVSSDAVWILAIDACRNELRLPTKAAGGGEKSFGVVPSSSGMLVSFAADEGQTARDLTAGSAHSPYAEALVEEIRRPGVSVSAVFGAIRPNVIRRTNGGQQPVSTNKLNLDPILVPIRSTPLATSPSVQASVATKPTSTPPQAKPLETKPAVHALPLNLVLERTFSRKDATELDAAMSPDGSLVGVAYFDNSAVVWDARTGKEAFSLVGHSAEVRSIEFSSDGSRLVTSSTDGTARIWDAHTGQPVLSVASPKGSSSSVSFSDAAFSRDGSRLITASSNHEGQIWDAKTGNLLTTLTGHLYWLFSAAFSPDGARAITTSQDNTAIMWDTRTGSRLLTLAPHPEMTPSASNATNIITSAVFSPDGSTILTSSNDKTARIWDAISGRQRLALKGHTSFVYDAVYSPDGTRIATVSYDATAAVWDAKTGTLLAKIPNQSHPILSAKFSTDGSRLLTAVQGGGTKVWRIENK